MDKVPFAPSTLARGPPKILGLLPVLLSLPPTHPGRQQQRNLTFFGGSSPGVEQSGS